MKKLSLLILFALLLGRAATAATYSGTVTDAPTGMPVANQMVYLCDTSGHPKDSMLTSASGAYSFTPGFMPANGFLVYVTACGVTQHSSYTYPAPTTGGIWNVAICGTPMRFWGGVYGYSPTNGYWFANAKVYLIAVTAINPATGDTTLTAVDSFVTNSQATFDVSYAALPTQWVTNGLRLKAALQPSDPQYANFLPSYFLPQAPVLNWRDAMPMYYQLHEIDIELMNGVNPGGPAFVGGSVLLGANKNAGVGDPLSKRLLLLTKSTGEAVAYTYSDANGKFSFPSLPLGSYNIFGDAMGKSNPALSFTLTQANKSIVNIVFEENSKTFKGRIGNLAVGGTSAVDAIRVFPNPARDVVNVQGLSAIGGSKTIILLNVAGAEVARQTVSKGEAALPVAGLPSGVYILQVQTPEGGATFRVTK